MTGGTFSLLGHDCPYGRYPAPVIPVGRLDGKLVALYPGAEGPHIEFVEGCEYVEHPKAVAESLRKFNYRVDHLFAFRPDRIERYETDQETDFFMDFLNRPEYRGSDPFLRLILAKQTANPDLILAAIEACAEQLRTTAPTSVGDWYRRELGELDVAAAVAAAARVTAGEGQWRLLIVDDDTYLLHALEKAFGNLQCVVSTAANGRQAIEKIQSERYHLVLLDLRMAGPDGFQFLAAKGDDPATRDIPVVVLTALTQLPHYICRK
jgi:hypothetical protein